MFWGKELEICLDANPKVLLAKNCVKPFGNCGWRSGRVTLVLGGGSLAAVRIGNKGKATGPRMAAALA